MSLLSSAQASSASNTAHPIALSIADMAATSTIVATEGAHPLLYASLMPISPLTKVPRIDLYKPKALYSVGRNPHSDIPLVSQCIDWELCTLQWDGRDEVRIVDLFSANGIWINRRRLTPGGSRVLQDGDTVFFSLCRFKDAPRHGDNPPRLRYQAGENYAYTYNQYTDRSPPLSSTDQSAWTRLNELERSHRRIEDELEKLRREREDVLKERQTIIDGLPAPPSFVRSDAAAQLRRTYDSWADIRERQDPSVVLPEDFRELCRPNTDDVACDLQWREEYQTVKYELSPPLDFNAQVGGLSDAYHFPGWPDWNEPDLVWGGHQPLDQSRPLTIPPSIIYWSAKYKLPVYAHPRFDPSSTRVYARPYASSMDGFSDLSAAKEHRYLNLPPLENPPIIRPRKLIFSRNGGPCQDEDVLAAKVTSLLPTLRPDDELLPELDPDRPKDMEVFARLKGRSDFIGYDDLKRKRELGYDSDECASHFSSSSSSPPPPIARDDAARDALVPNPKRRKITAFPSPHPHIDTPSALLSENAGVLEDPSGSVAASDIPDEARPSSPEGEARRHTPCIIT